MPANVYECMFLLDTNKVAGDVPAATQQIHSLLERNHAEVLASRPWDERRLAYPIKGHKKGLYFLTYFKADGKGLANLEHDVQLSDLILRHLVLRIDPKMVDAHLAVGRDPHALALQSVHEPPEGEGGGDGEPKREPKGEEGHGHRRGRRGGEERD
jgi:small subunit ribosomal protein S6